MGFMFSTLKVLLDNFPCLVVVLDVDMPYPDSSGNTEANLNTSCSVTSVNFFSEWEDKKNTAEET